MARRLAVLDAPSNLGLRPPAPGVVPGCYKAPGALRDHGLLHRLGARDAGVLTPPRYVPDHDPRVGDRNGEAIAVYSQKLAERLARVWDAGEFPVVLGGDCSILLGAALGLKARGRFGLVFMDGHSDFRHPGNSPEINNAAGEDLAIVTGRGDARLVDLQGRGPYVRDEDVVLLGLRPDDLYLPELRRAGVRAVDSAELRRTEPEAAADAALQALAPDVAGFWIHMDVDVLDGALMPAADSPEPGGPDFAYAARLLRRLAADPRAQGMELTIYDPDLDPDGRCGAALADMLVEALTR